jgi:GTP-sensing pleiotropic transcriptional regulator CodY
MTDKEFNLSDKRKELYLKLCKSEGTMKVLPLASIFQRIEQQDKEFIKKLKEETEQIQMDCATLDVCEKEAVNKIIDKLCGDKLIEKEQKE